MRQKWIPQKFELTHKHTQDTQSTHRQSQKTSCGCQRAAHIPTSPHPRHPATHLVLVDFAAFAAVVFCARVNLKQTQQRL